MSEQKQLLADMTERLFADMEAAGDASFAEAWAQIEEMQLQELLVPEDAGGFGGDWEDFFTVARLSGFYGVAAPVGEAIIARWISRAAGWTVSDGVDVIAPIISGTLSENGAFSGEIAQTPWGRNAAFVVADVDGKIIRLSTKDARGSEQRVNPAGEPRDRLTFENAPAEIYDTSLRVFQFGGLLRAAQISGALDRTLSLSIEHANERQQFGRPIAKFQAVQQNLAVLAEEAAAANSAGRAAALAASVLDEVGFEFSAAKLRANMAVGAGTAIGHQVHGAIGFTQEHKLQHFTRRLTAWRSEFGGDAQLAEMLGRKVSTLGADNLWAYLTDRSDQTGALCNRQ